jgi:hypothetical protein
MKLLALVSIVLLLALSGCGGMSYNYVVGDGSHMWLRGWDEYEGRLSYFYCHSGDKNATEVPKPVCVEAEWLKVQPRHATIAAPVNADELLRRERSKAPSTQLLGPSSDD